MGAAYPALLYKVEEK